MKDYKISVIVPVYNAEEYLERCVDSLVNQTYENLEILLVNDGSTDTSMQLCTRYAADDERIRVISKENGGLISAWKKGVEESTGKYLCFIDSDDWMDLCAIQELAGQLTGSQKEIISSDYIIEKENGQKKYVWQELAPGTYEEPELKKKVVPQLLGREKRQVCMSRCMKLISRELILDNMKYSDPAVKMAEDVTIMLPALMDCQRLVIMNHQAWYHYYYVTSSMAHKYDSGMYANIRHLREIMYQVIGDKLVGMERAHMLQQADKEYLLLLFLVLKNEARGNPKGYRYNIEAICQAQETVQLVREAKLEISENANRLIYLTLKYPNCFTISLLRLAMIVYYGK